MSANFELSHARLGAEPEFSGLAEVLSRWTKIDCPTAFNGYCREACRLWTRQFGGETGKPSGFFDELLARIESQDAATIHTSWGGVVITLHEHPRVEKYLVIRRGGYLALEKHAQKDEHLEVREGVGLLLSRRSPEQPLMAEALVPGGRFHFEPGMEHCLIGTGHLLVFERSLDPKGMDQDLIFLYEPDGSA